MLTATSRRPAAICTRSAEARAACGSMKLRNRTGDGLRWFRPQTLAGTLVRSRRVCWRAEPACGLAAHLGCNRTGPFPQARLRFRSECECGIDSDSVSPPLSSFADRQFGTESCSQLTNIVTETVFHIARFVEATLHQLLDPCLRGGALHGSKERAPLGGDLRVRR